MARRLPSLIRMRLAILLIVTLLASSTVGVPYAFADRAATENATFTGAWAGEWKRSTGGSSHPVDVVFVPTRDPAEVVAQFTFLSGAQTWTSRRAGVVVDDAVRFELPGGGAIVLRAERDGMLEGTFEAPSGRLPAERGSIRLSRVR